MDAQEVGPLLPLQWTAEVLCIFYSFHFRNYFKRHAFIPGPRWKSVPCLLHQRPSFVIICLACCGEGYNGQDSLVWPWLTKYLFHHCLSIKAVFVKFVKRWALQCYYWNCPHLKEPSEKLLGIPPGCILWELLSWGVGTAPVFLAVFSKEPLRLQKFSLLINTVSPVCPGLKQPQP